MIVYVYIFQSKSLQTAEESKKREYKVYNNLFLSGGYTIIVLSFTYRSHCLKETEVKYDKLAYSNIFPCVKILRFYLF